MPDNCTSVREAVTAYMTVYGASPVAHERLTTFLDNLRKDERWTEEELAEVRRKIEERLSHPSG